MTIQELIQQLQEMIQHGTPPTAVITAYDPEVEDVVNVTGLLHNDKTVEICTDDPE